MTGARRPAAALALAGALLGATACAPSVDPFERLGRKAAERVGSPDGSGGPSWSNPRAEPSGPSRRSPYRERGATRD
ncbi:hypothetical protein [Streptomyces sp. NPDC053755]|uniref:hypothetical protein n=1 Tax=Streptomyces sp. NPDC053755 TaxID=3155815 RepID=UPI0034386467